MADNFPLGWLCVLPPLLTIFLAIVTQRVVVSLLLGIMLAVALMLSLPVETALTEQAEPANWLARFACWECRWL